MTTASLLLQMYGVAPSSLEVMPFHAIEAAVVGGKVDAGVLIHEARFTCENRGLVKVLDFGIWWEALTGLPLPLGGIVAKRRLGRPTLELVEQAIGRSIDRLFAVPDEARDFIRSHAQESDDVVLDGHIGLYVNEFTRHLGKDGEVAVEEFFCPRRGQRIAAPLPRRIVRMISVSNAYFVCGNKQLSPAYKKAAPLGGRFFFNELTGAISRRRYCSPCEYCG